MFCSSYITSAIFLQSEDSVCVWDQNMCCRSPLSEQCKVVSSMYTLNNCCVPLSLSPSI